MKKFSYLLFLPVLFILILFSSCHKKKDGKEGMQLSSRKISFTTLGVNFARELNEKLYKAVLEGKIKAYRYDSITPTCLFKAEEITSLSTMEESIQYAPDSSRPDFLIDTVLKQVFKADDIVGYSIAEKWSMDPKENEIEGEIFAFAINWQPEIAGIEIPESALFWVDYKDVVKLLSKGQSEELKKTIYNTFIVKLSNF
jgi:hypothetical protein